MAPLVYALCAITALFCAGLLLRTYYRTRYRLLLWSGLCFTGLTVNNALLVVDKMLPDINLFFWRLVVALVSLLIFLYGLIWNGK
jgi:uncharacterized protein DUF5985